VVSRAPQAHRQSASPSGSTRGRLATSTAGLSEQAGASATNDRQRMMAPMPTQRHQPAALVPGSKNEAERPTTYQREAERKA
jgi:fructose-1,6-bisphosphatase